MFIFGNNEVIITDNVQKFVISYSCYIIKQKIFYTRWDNVGSKIVYVDSVSIKIYQI